jgi:hypothetical protein
VGWPWPVQLVQNKNLEWKQTAHPTIANCLYLFIYLFIYITIFFIRRYSFHLSVIFPFPISYRQNKKKMQSNSNTSGKRNENILFQGMEIPQGT